MLAEKEGIPARLLKFRDTEIVWSGVSDGGNPAYIVQVDYETPNLAGVPRLECALLALELRSAEAEMSPGWGVDECPKGGEIAGLPSVADEYEWLARMNGFRREVAPEKRSEARADTLARKVDPPGKQREQPGQAEIEYRTGPPAVSAGRHPDPGRPDGEVAPVVAGPITSGPSFPCANRSVLTGVESTICDHEQLRRLDVSLDSMFNARIRLAQKRAERAFLREDQRAWLRERDACPTVACIEQRYQDRIGVLDDR